VNEKWIFRTLEQLLGWDDEQVRNEFRWLRMMARVKYDGYQDYFAGMRFLPSLVVWLQQFELEEERRVAYRFVRERLIYVSPGELQRLVELFFPDRVHQTLLQDATATTSIEAHRWLVTPNARDLYKKFLRQTLFLGLSDGARIDLLRRANAGTISNEQVVVATQIDEGKWTDLLGDLRESLGDTSARFRTVYLIDDFTASGTSLIRLGEGKWKGKLARFFKSVAGRKQELFDDKWTLHVHHYIAGPGSLEYAERLAASAANERDDWHPIASFSAGLKLDEITKITPSSDPDFIRLCEKYYNPCFVNRHTREGGTESVALGFGGCALPLVLEHNTPNNSVLLLWGDSMAEGCTGKVVRPLFRRRQRHGSNL
jgi:hypothetical protein